MTAARGNAGWTIYLYGARTKSRYHYSYHLIARGIINVWTFYKLFGPRRDVNLIPTAIYKSGSCLLICSLRSFRETWLLTMTSTYFTYPISKPLPWAAKANIHQDIMLHMYISCQFRLGKYASYNPFNNTIRHHMLWIFISEHSWANTTIFLTSKLTIQGWLFRCYLRQIFITNLFCFSWYNWQSWCMHDTYGDSGSRNQCQTTRFVHGSGLLLVAATLHAAYTCYMRCY